MSLNRSVLSVVVVASLSGCLELLPCSENDDCPDGAICADTGFCAVGADDPDDAVGRFSEERSCEVISPPRGLGLGSYDAYLNCAGIAIVALGDVPEHTMLVTDQIIAFMLDGNDDILTRMIEKGDYLILRGDGVTLDDLPDDDSFDYVGDNNPQWNVALDDHRATLRSADIACDGDGFFGSNTVVDSFSLLLLFDGVPASSPKGQALLSAFENAQQERLWDNTIGDLDDVQYFGQLTTKWFEVGRPPGPPEGNGFDNDIVTREQLLGYDPVGHELMRTFFTPSFHVPGCVYRNKHCSSAVSDIDGNTYRLQLIEDRCWLAENLATTQLVDGTPIGNVTGDAAWAAATTPAYAAYDNDNGNTADNGLLYNHAAVVAATGLCPETMRMPNETDGDNMIAFVDSASPILPAAQMRAAGKWSVEAKDTHGFSAIPSGIRGANGFFEGLGDRFTMWTSSGTAVEAIAFTVDSVSTTMNGLPFDPKSGFSVRCLRDAEDNF